MKGRSPTTRARILRHRPGADGAERVRDVLAVEEPLEIRLSWREPDGSRRTEAVAVTMRTPGDDFELAAGFLRGEGILADPSVLHGITYCTGGAEEQEYNVVEVRLRPGLAVDVERLRRNFYTSSSCGVCGKASLEAVEAQGCSVLPAGTPTLAAAAVPELPDRLRAAQGVFEDTGGLHAAGLFDAASGELELVREDVGRHNAVDKVVGRRFLDGALPAEGRVLVVSGRASFEIVQKAVAAGIAVLVAVGAPSSLAVELAERFGQTLVGFARDGGFNVYAGAERIR